MIGGWPRGLPNWSTGAVIVLIGVVAAAVGALAFQRRDVEYA